MAGLFQKKPQPGTAGRFQEFWVDAYGYQTPHIPALQLDGTSASGADAVGTWTTGLGAFREADILVDVTAVSGGTTSPSVAFYVDTRLDGTGTTNIAQLTAITTAAQAVVHLTKRQASGEVVVTADAGAGTVRAIGFGDDLRIRRVITGTSPTVTYRVWLNVGG